VDAGVQHRAILRHLSHISAMSASRNFVGAALPPSTADKPNIIYIIVDDMGYGDLSCYGQKAWTTPNIDRLASEGIKFTSHYSGSTVCAPSRSSLMTGQDQGHTRVRGNGEFRLLPEDTTVAELLKSAGYATAMVGKSCVTGNVKAAQTPFECGFDTYYGTLDHRTAHHHWPQFVFDDGELVEIPGNRGKTGEVFIQNRYTDKALEFVSENADKPFFLLLSYSTPHADIDAPLEDVEPFLGKFEPEVAYKGGHYKGTETIKANYAGMLANLDKNVGKLLAKLKELGIDENTVVSFTSDNGPTMAGGYNWEYFDSNGIYRGGKRDLYEGGIRVPFLVRWPAKIEAGRETDHPSAFWDFLPTACDLAGVEKPDSIQGVSYLPSLIGEEQPEHDYLYWEFHEKGGKVAVRQGDWKLVGVDRMKNKPKPWELYNLAKDVEEQNDLAKTHPKKLKELKAIFESHRQPSEVPHWNLKAVAKKK
ncbi:MAG: arylsulfatase, partial [Verrucomicrobiota bacterium]